MDSTGLSIRQGRNYPFQHLVLYLRYLITQRLDIGLLDETNYNGNIDMDLKVSVQENFTLEEAREELQHYGLDLVPADRLMDVLVIREK